MTIPSSEDQGAKQRRVTAPKEQVLALLESFGPNHFGKLDHFDPGIEFIDSKKRYDYTTELMSDEQSRSLHSLIQKWNREPQKLKNWLSSSKKK